jgi:hypothetical protein
VAPLRPARLATAAVVHHRAVSTQEPGLDLHEWETRWQELEPLLEDDAASALPEACDFVERVLLESRIGLERVGGENDELIASYEAARETADAVERGGTVDPGDVGAAIVNLRAVYEAVIDIRRI